MFFFTIEMFKHGSFKVVLHLFIIFNYIFPWAPVIFGEANKLICNSLAVSS